MTTRNRQDICTTEPTRYEVAMVRGTEILHVFGFTSRKSKQGILALLTDVDHLLTKEEQVEADTKEIHYTRKNGFLIAGNVKIKFTGRTERECAITN